MATSEAQLELRRLTSPEDFDSAVGLQSRVWGFSDSDLVAARLFRVFVRIGGSCLGAFADRRMVGFTLAFAALKPGGRPYWHSHMAAVEPGLQHQGIGFRLKLKQRSEALACGLDLIEWTFDPLQARNAYFNIEKLGASVEAYLPDFYGITSSGLHGALPTDRLVAAWHLTSAQVAARLGGASPRTAAAEHRIEIPAHIGDLPREEALRTQRRVRSSFQAALSGGWAVAGFERGDRTGAYLLSR